MAEIDTLESQSVVIVDLYKSGKISALEMVRAINELKEAEKQQQAQAQQPAQPVQSAAPVVPIPQMAQAAAAQIQNARGFMNPQQSAQPAVQAQQPIQPVVQPVIQPQVQQPAQPAQPAAQVQQPVPRNSFQRPIQQPVQPVQTQQSAQPVQPAAQAQQPVQPVAQPVTGPQANAAALNNIDPNTARVEALKQLQPSELIARRKVVVSTERKLKLKHNFNLAWRSSLYMIVTIIGTAAVGALTGNALYAMSPLAMGIGSLIAMQTTAVNKKNTNTKWNFLNKFQDWMKDTALKKDIGITSQYKDEIDAEVDSRLATR